MVMMRSIRVKIYETSKTFGELGPGDLFVLAHALDDNQNVTLYSKAGRELAKCCVGYGTENFQHDVKVHEVVTVGAAFE